jgi:hypothetical protein
MPFPPVDINFVAVFVAAIASMVIGAFWYSPVLFGNAWIKLSGMSKKDIEKAKQGGMGGKYFLGFVASLVMAYVLSYFVDYAGAVVALEGAQVGFWVWLGFIAPVQLGVVLWENKPVKLFWMNTLYYLVTLAVMGIILAAWV